MDSRKTLKMCIRDSLGDEPVDMLEINISCPNVKEGGIAFGQDPKAVEAITREVKKYAKQPVIMKVSPNVTDITVMAKAAEAGGADVLSLINTLTGMKIDINKRTFAVANRTGGMSGPAVKPVAVRMVYHCLLYTSTAYTSDLAAGRTTQEFSRYLERWKSNARGVDLNHNFDALWTNTSSNWMLPSFSGYKGLTPVSEPESQALVNLMNSNYPWAAVLNYHSMGKVIYWDIEGNKEKEKSQQLAQLMSAATCLLYTSRCV